MNGIPENLNHISDSPKNEEEESDDESQDKDSERESQDKSEE